MEDTLPKHLGRVYKIFSPTLSYVGSTTKPLQYRLCQHICKWYKYKETKTGDYYTSFKIFDECDTYEITLLEEVEYNNVKQLKEREQWWINETLNCVNKQKAWTNLPDWKADWNLYHREYYNANKSRISAWNKQHYQKNREKILTRIRERRLAKKSEPIHTQPPNQS
jgi:hypothetical protein